MRMAHFIQILLQNQYLFASAESCTGGLLASRLTRFPGVSSIYWGGVICYSNEAKMKFLGVDPDLIQRHGAVSEEVAGAMIRGLRKCSGAQVGVSITGIAGPGGGSDKKPVGLVYFGFFWPKKHGEQVVRCQFFGSRMMIQRQAVQFAIDFLGHRI